MGEIKKQKYVYYHCTGYADKCRGEPATCRRKYVREEVLEEQFTELLGQLTFDDDVLEWVREALQASHADQRGEHQEAIARRFCWRLGVRQRGLDEDMALITAAEAHMKEDEIAPDAFFFAHRAARTPPVGVFGDLLREYEPTADLTHPLWSEDAPPTLIIDEVERVWAAIDERDDWTQLNHKIAAIRRLGDALGEPPPRGN